MTCWRIFDPLVLLVIAAGTCFAQSEEAEPSSFNQEKEHGVSLGVSISSFNRNITYQISPAYHFRTGKHQIMVNPFVGRLDEVNKQFDFGFGLNYRIYPFKNRNLTRAFIQVGADYVFQDNPSRSAQSMLYRFGPGIEVSISDRFTGGINIDLALLQQLSAVSKNSESPDSGFAPNLRFKVLPFIRFAYAISKGARK